MFRSFFKRKKKRINMFCIEFNIMVNGESYYRTVNMAGKNKDDAFLRWNNLTKKSTSGEEYLFISINPI